MLRGHAMPFDITAQVIETASSMRRLGPVAKAFLAAVGVKVQALPFGGVAVWYPTAMASKYTGLMECFCNAASPMDW